MRKRELTELLTDIELWDATGVKSWDGFRGFIYFNHKDDDNLGLEIQYHGSLGLRVNKFKRDPYNCVCVIDTDKLTAKNREQIRTWFDKQFGFNQ